MVSLIRWAETFKKLDLSPWPGPRPLTESESDAFIGRDEEVAEFLARVNQGRLIVLTGESGVGKSSLLNAKLISAQKARGRTPVLCKQWPSPGAEKIDTDEYLKSVITSEPFNNGNITVSADDDRSLGAIMDEAFGPSGLLIFDQFEELIRYHPDMFDHVADWITRFAYTHGAKIVISLRSEYLHRLRKIERGAPSFGYSVMYLEPMTDTESVRLIVENNQDGIDEDPVRNPIEKQAADELVKLWSEQSRADGDDWLRARTGLLHLQATLYVLHAEAGNRSESKITADLVRDFADSAKADTGVIQKGNVFDFGLREAVRLKLDRCAQACSEIGLGSTLTDGAMVAAYRMFPHLTSGGFKADRAAIDLATIALERSLEQLLPDYRSPGPAELLEKVFGELWRLIEPADGINRSEESHDAAEGSAEVFDLLNSPRACIAMKLGLADFRISEMQDDEKSHLRDLEPWIDDDKNVSAGVMFGFSPNDILIEEMRRVVLAQYWLEQSQLVRTSSRDAGKFITLVHDRVGDALEVWSKTDSKTLSMEPFFLLTAAKGRYFNWLETEIPSGSEWFNLRWRDCQVSAKFRDIVFVNCDFSGTRFTDCVFEGVTFVNCVLDNGTFDNCTVIGGVLPIGKTAASPERKSTKSKKQGQISENSIYETNDIEGKLSVQEGRPCFAVRISDKNKIQELVSYRSDRSVDVSAVTGKVFSSMSGVSVMSWQEDHADMHPFYYPHEPEGVAMYGGRLSSLMIRSCKFDRNGKLAFRIVAGSALDIVETEECNLEVAYSVIRGVNITRPVEAGYDEVLGPVELIFRDSYLANTWIGYGLQGNAMFEHCVIFQMLNMSDAENLEVSLVKECLGIGLTGKMNSDDSVEIVKDPNDWYAKACKRKGLEEAMLKCDHRSVPARLALST